MPMSARRQAAREAGALGRAPSGRQRIAPLDFWTLFTEAEQDAIDLAADTPGPVRRLRRQLQLARYVEQGHPLTEAGITALVAAGLLTTRRAADVRAFRSPQ